MRSKDRLQELRHRAAGAGGSAPPSTPATAPAEPPELASLLREVEAARGWVVAVAEGARQVRALHAHPAYHTSTQLQEQADACVTQSHAAGLKACGALRQLGERARAARGGDAGSRAARMLYDTTRRQCGEALDALHAAVGALRDDRRTLLQQHIKLTNATISEEECQALLDAGHAALFVDNVVSETAAARLALREAEARRDELLRLEGALQDVRQLFSHLAHLVALQQDQVDTVEYYALQAGEHVHSGGHQLGQGTLRRRRASQKKLGLALCLATGILIVLVILVLT